MTKCSVNNCQNISKARRLCKKHYDYYSRHNILPDKEPYKRPKRQKEETIRFWERVDKNNINGCWIWLGAKTQQGYGQFLLDNKKIVRAHRYSFLISNGYIDNDKYVCHTCDNPVCVNPKHLWLGSAAENNADCRNKNRAVLPPDQKGENHSQHILKEKDVVDMRKRFNNGVKQATLMREYKVSRNTIYKVCRNITWKNIGEVQ